MITIDREMAIALLTAAIDERGPDYVYHPVGSGDLVMKKCVYAADGKPSCGVGLALSKAGVPVAELEKLDRAVSEMDATVATGLHDILNWGLTSVRVTVSGAYALDQFQRAQDRGATWREAFLQAVRS